jgi:uncharacterized protein YkwD
VINSTEKVSEAATESATNDIQFSEEGVASVSSKKDFATSDGATSSITIEAEPDVKKETIGIVVEKTTTGSHRKVAYEYDTTALTNEIHALSNAARAKEKLPPLTFDTTLAQLAIERSTEMAQLQYLSHTSPSGCDLECRFKKSGHDSSAWGENLAEYEPYSTTDPDKLARTLVGMWINSSEHHRNLTSSEYTHHGIGVATFDNRIVVTVVFAAE